jgi:hypothetical protein
MSEYSEHKNPDVFAGQSVLENDDNLNAIIDKYLAEPNPNLINPTRDGEYILRMVQDKEPGLDAAALEVVREKIERILVTKAQEESNENLKS